jgi:hypothetical protein
VTVCYCADQCSNDDERAARKKRLGAYQQSARNIRLFISSTFRDMDQERELLIKQVLPELRKECLARAIFLSEVDLRWGITDEQSQAGDTIRICLGESMLLATQTALLHPMLLESSCLSACVNGQLIVAGPTFYVCLASDMAGHNQTSL